VREISAKWWFIALVRVSRSARGRVPRFAQTRVRALLAHLRLVLEPDLERFPCAASGTAAAIASAKFMKSPAATARVASPWHAEKRSERCPLGLLKKPVSRRSNTNGFKD
jgi:hypothetical protein